MVYEQLKEWSRENGRAIPFLKSNRKWGLKGSTALDRKTFKESYEALRQMFPGTEYPIFTEIIYQN